MEDGKQNINVIGVKDKKIENVEQFLKTIEQGSKLRVTSENSINSESSRSHAIL